MLGNVLKIFLRKTSKQLGFFTFQLWGLITGISVFLIIFSFYQFENSFDSHFSEYERIYRIEKTEKHGNDITLTTNSSRLIPELARKEIPEVENAIGLINGSYHVTQVHYPEDKAWSWLKRHWVSKEFFEIFDFKVLEGKKETLLDDPNSIVITQSMASMIFREEPAIGKTIFIWGRPRLISGVIEDAPKNSHMQFDFVASTENFYDRPQWDAERMASWNYLNTVLNYIKLSKGADPKIVEEKINTIYSRYKLEGDPERNFSLVPVNDIHLHSNARWQITESGNSVFVQSVFYTGLIIVLLTLINFMKISVADVTQRIKETGIRRVLGGKNNSMMLSIISENLIIILIAILLSFGLIYTFGSLAIDWLPIGIYQDYLTSSLTITVLISFLLIGSLIPSIIPIGILSRIPTSNALKGTVTSAGHNYGFLRALMSFQVLFSLILITLTFFFKDQINFILNKETGFEKEKVMYIELHAENAEVKSLEAFKQYLHSISGINSVTNSIQVPLKWPGGQNYSLRFEGEEKEILISRSGVNHDFFKTLEVDIIAGREFSEDFSDSTTCILNESAVKNLGLDDPIGRRVIHSREDRPDEFKTVVGVVKDFNFRSMHSPLRPAQFIWIPRGPIISINYNPNSIESIIANIETNWNRFNLEGNFNYTFLDDYFASQHKEDIQLKNSISHLSVVIIFLASLGIFGMSAFIGQRKQKEVAIRKVLGSTGLRVFWLLTKNYVYTVSIALILALYPVYYLVNLWFDNFAYVTSINFINYGYGLLVVLSIVVFVSGINSIKVVVENPVDILNND